MERSCADAIQHCFTALAKQASPQWILEADIKGCFDNISHEWLLANIPMDKAILRKWLKAGVIEGKTLFSTEAGTPQGGIISPVLANMTLDGLQALLHSRYRRGYAPWVKLGNPKVHLVRYADDFIITGASEEILAEVKILVEQFLAERGLSLSAEKTRITHIEEGFDFLGQNVRKYNGKPIIKPSKKSIKRFYGVIREIIKRNPTATQVTLIKRLNPVIMGWSNYHRHQVSSKVFSRLDHLIWHALYRWARRRHPNKGKRWVMDLYFRKVGGRKQHFAALLKMNGKETHVKLRHCADVKIFRHVKIQNTANPYDAAWEEYFEKRLGYKMASTLAGRKRLLALWRSQGGRCPHCSLPITKQTGWNNHHLVRKVDGGGDGNGNRVLLHPNCHGTVHAIGIKVVKPGNGHAES